MLVKHPALSKLDSADGKANIAAGTAGKGTRFTLKGLVAGLISCAKDCNGGGFRQAAAELHGLNGPPDDSMPDFKDLSIGFHVVLLNGLLITDRICVSNNLAIALVETLDAYVRKGVVRDVAPVIVNRHARNSGAAIIAPFRWSPSLNPPNEEFATGLDWGRSFFADVTALVELLALSFATPVVALALIPYCIHRTAYHLLGQPHCNVSCRWGRSVQNAGGPFGSEVLNPEALSATKDLLKHRGSNRYRDCEPVISRLAESLARSGRFHKEDGILNVGIGLEQPYRPDGSELSITLNSPVEKGGASDPANKKTGTKSKADKLCAQDSPCSSPASAPSRATTRQCPQAPEAETPTGDGFERSARGCLDEDCRRGRPVGKRARRPVDPAAADPGHPGRRAVLIPAGAVEWERGLRDSGRLLDLQGPHEGRRDSLPRPEPRDCPQLRRLRALEGPPHPRLRPDLPRPPADAGCAVPEGGTISRG